MFCLYTYVYEAIYNKITSRIKIHSQKNPVSPKISRITEQTKLLIEKREKLMKLNNKSTVQKIEYAKIRKLVWREIRNDVLVHRLLRIQRCLTTYEP